MDIVFESDTEKVFMTIRTTQIFLNNIIFKGNFFHNCSVFILEESDLLANYVEIVNTIFESQYEKNSFIFFSMYSNLIFNKFVQMNNIFSGNIKILSAKGNFRNKFTFSLFYVNNLIFKDLSDNSAIFYFDNFLTILIQEIYFSNVNYHGLSMFQIINATEINLKNAFMKNITSNNLIHIKNINYLKMLSFFILQLVSSFNDNPDTVYDAHIFIHNSLNSILENITLCFSTMIHPFLVILIESIENSTIIVNNQNIINNIMVQTKMRGAINSSNMLINLCFSKIEKMKRRDMNLTNFLILNNFFYNDDEKNENKDLDFQFIFINLNFYVNLYILNFNFFENLSKFDGILLKLIGENLQMSRSNFIDNHSFKEKYLINIFLSSRVFFMDTLNFLKNTIGTSSLILIENSNQDIFNKGIFDRLKMCNNTSFYSQMKFDFNLQEFRIEILNSIFDLNYCLTKGGVIQTSYFDYNSFLIFFNCTFKNNLAFFFGGVFYFANLGNNIVINKTYFISNSITREGGGVFCVYGDPNTKITLKSCYFEKNFSPKKGGIYFILTGKIFDEMSIYVNNSAYEGGVIAISFFSVFIMRNCTSLKSSASLNSGFLKMMGQSEVTLIDSKICYSFASRGGVVLAGGMTLLNIKNSTFYSNSAEDASFLYAANSAFIILIEYCLLLDNFGMQNLFEIASSSISLSNSFLKNNSVNIFHMELANLIINSIIIENTMCQGKRGGCLLYMTSTSFLIAFKLFASNLSSTSDDGIICSSCSNLQISDSYLKNWKQNFSGSSFYDTSSILSIKRVFICNYDNRAFSLSGSLFIMENSSILQNIDKIRTIKNLKGFISCLRCQDFQLISSLIKGIDNLEIKSGAIQLIESYANSIFEINNSIISDSRGIMGGGLYAENISINIINSNFTKNNADSGGAIYFKCNYNRLCSMKLLGNNFLENRANFSGGAIKWFSNIPIIEQNNIFSKNKGLYGDNISSQPVRLILDDPSLFKQFLEYQSGNVSSLFEFHIVDFYGQKVKNESGFGFISFQNRLNENNEKNAIQIKTDKISFNNIKIIGTPNSYATLLISTSIIESFFDKLIFPSQNPIFQDFFDESTHSYYLALNITFRDCKIGEIYIPNKNICQECPFHYFSLNRNDTVCQICPENALCNGGRNIFVLPSFWRENENSTKIYSCFNSNACLGGFNSTCRYGYTGPLCDVCMIDDANYFYKFGQGACENCEDMNVLGLILILLFSSAWGFYLIFTIKKNIQLSKRSNEFSEDLPILLKIGADYFQIVSTIFLLNISLPINLSYIFQVIEKTISLSSILFPFECILAKYTTFINIFFLKMILGSLVAWAILFISIFFWLIYILIKKKGLKYFKTEMIITIIIVGFSLQSPLISLYLTAMNCIEINEIKYVKKQLILKCWESEHLRIFFAFLFPSILLWAIILPFICWIYVSKNIYSINQQTKASLVFITEGIRKEYYYWEFLMMAKRLFINIFSVFFESDDEILCVSIILLILYFFSIFFFNSKPYKKQQLNSIYAISIYSSEIIFMSFLLCLIMKNNQIYSILSFILFILGFILFIWKFAKLYYFASKYTLKLMVKKIYYYRNFGLALLFHNNK